MNEDKLKDFSDAAKRLGRIEAYGIILEAIGDEIMKSCSVETTEVLNRILVQCDAQLNDGKGNRAYEADKRS